MELNLAGKRAAVAASSGGLGYAIASALAREGARVAISSRSRDRIEAAAERIGALGAGDVTASTVDVSEPGSFAAWADELGDRWGGLDIIVPNAGGPPPGTFAETEPADWDAAYRLTLRSAMEAAKAGERHLADGGAMLFLTSSSVRQPSGSLAMSTVFRSGVRALAKLLADEWAPRRIRVNHLIPGRIATERVERLDSDTAERRGMSLRDVKEAFERGIPLGRYGDAGEFADAAVFLLSDAASYITGATLQVDGGALREI